MSDSEEEILVTIDFMDPVTEATELSEYKAIGLDTNEPIFQYGRQVFKGEWKDVIGTKVYLEESKTPKSLDPVFQPDISKQYECRYLTKKVLKLETLVLTPKEDKGQSKEAKEEVIDEDEDSCEAMDIDVLPMKR